MNEIYNWSKDYEKLWELARDGKKVLTRATITYSAPTRWSRGYNSIEIDFTDWWDDEKKEIAINNVVITDNKQLFLDRCKKHNLEYIEPIKTAKRLIQKSVFKQYEPEIGRCELCNKACGTNDNYCSSCGAKFNEIE